jgi:hypothetical protein
MFIVGYELCKLMKFSLWYMPPLPFPFPSLVLVWYCYRFCIYSSDNSDVPLLYSSDKIAETASVT